MVTVPNGRGKPVRSAGSLLHGSYMRYSAQECGSLTHRWPDPFTASMNAPEIGRRAAIYVSLQTFLSSYYDAPGVAPDVSSRLLDDAYAALTNPRTTSS